MVNMRVVRLTYRVTPYLTISGAQQEKGNTTNLNERICCNKNQKITNTAIKKTMSITFF